MIIGDGGWRLADRSFEDLWAGGLEGTRIQWRTELRTAWRVEWRAEWRTASMREDRSFEDLWAGGQEGRRAET
jgi:hypothetical protein